ncbi:hypothetical protein SFC07_11130 [Corynebacterium callunae]|uniref:hypothetical protein n=1 Tax=Corynebacterium callunae TaxID=1721 RepID=UPI003982735E
MIVHQVLCPKKNRLIRVAGSKRQRLVEVGDLVSTVPFSWTSMMSVTKFKIINRRKFVQVSTLIAWSRDLESKGLKKDAAQLEEFIEWVSNVEFLMKDKAHV